MKRLLTILLSLTLTLTLALAGPKKGINFDSYYMQLGMDALKNGQIEEALQSFEKVLQGDSTNGYAHFWIGIGLADKGEVDASLTAINNALTYLPKKEKSYLSSAYGVRAEVYLIKQDTTAALDDYAKAIKCIPERKSLYEDRAELYFELHQYDLSNKDYDKLLELDPNSVYAYMGKGRNFRDLKQYDLAIRYFSYALQMYPNFSRGYSFRAECFILQKKYNEAADDIIAALDLDGDSKARGLMIYKYTGDKMDIIKHKLERMTHKEPKRTLWRHNLAVLLEANDQYKDAIMQYKEAKRINPNAIVDERIAVCHASMGNYAKALEYLNLVIAKDTTKANLYSRRAHYYSELGEYQKAIEDYDKYVEMMPGNSRAYFLRGWEKHMAGQHEDAIEDLSISINMDSTFSVAYDGRGRSYLSLGQIDLAKADFEKILSFDTVPATNSCAAFAYHFLGQDSIAIDYALRCLEVDPRTLYNVACAYALAGNAEKAVEYLRKDFEDGFVRLYHLSRDVDFDAIRQDPAFQALIEEYTQKIQQSWVE
ncbi:MAG: tetratricopeptide repeat protein [Paludibacteraceae bacterium]|nr:tetratricopeptide repeat protein [Paludibacteraceae bacterium]